MPENDGEDQNLHESVDTVVQLEAPHAVKSGLHV